MAIGAPFYSSTSTTRSQTLPNSSDGQTNHTITTRGRLLTTGTASSISATSNVSATISYTFSKVNAISGAVTQFGTATLSSGSNSANISVTAETRFELDDLIRAQAGTFSPSPQAPTITASWTYYNGQFTEVPQVAGKIWAPSGGSWRSIKEVWGAQEDPFNIGQFIYARLWKVPDPAPDGVAVTVSQQQFQDGPVQAAWTNTTNVDGMQFDVRWWINDSIYTTTGGNVNGSNVAQTITLAEENFSNGDKVQAQMRYISGGEPGNYGSLSTAIFYVAGSGGGF